jgi:hypothetical protein
VGYTKRPFNYTGNLDDQVQHDLELANDNFETLAQAFVNNDPTTGKVKVAERVEGSNFAFNVRINQVEFTTNGTWVVPDGVDKIFIIAVAGGGGGAGGYWRQIDNFKYEYYYGEGGKCGEAFIGIKNVTPGETLTIIVGTGGAGGAGGYIGYPGKNGTDTVITGSTSGNILTLRGGSGGGGTYSSPVPATPSIFGHSGYGSGGEGGYGESGEAGKNGIVRIIYFA